MGDIDKRIAITSVLVSDVDNKTGIYVYGSYTIPLFVQYVDDGGEEQPYIMNPFIKRIYTTNENIEIQNDTVYYNNTFSSMEETYEHVLLVFGSEEDQVTMSLAEVMSFPNINVLPKMNTNNFANVTLINSNDSTNAYVAYVTVKDEHNTLYLASLYIDVGMEDSAYIPLLNGACIIDESAFENVDFTVTPIITGDAELSDSQIVIHGDCTIELYGTESSDDDTPST